MARADRSETSRNAGQLLLAEKERLLRIWQRRVRDDPDVPEAERLPEPLLRDDMPGFVDGLARALGCADLVDASDAVVKAEACAKEHARQRISEQYGVRSALREWGHMHAALLEVIAGPGGVVDAETAHVIGAVVHTSMVRAGVEMQRAALADVERAAAELAAVIESVPEAIYIGTAAGVSRANRAALELLGYDSVGEMNRDLPVLVEQLAIRDPATGRGVPPGDLAYARALAGERNVSEVTVRHLKTKQDMIVRTAAAPVVLGGEVLGAVAINTDVTAARHAEARLADEATFRERFIGILGHDLRNPLSTIVMGITTLMAQGDAPPGHLRVLRRLMRSAQRMTGMIDAILDLTRARLGGGIPLQPRDVDLAALCRTALEEFEGMHPGREIRFEARGDTRGFWDPDRLAQVVSNLVGNALEHGATDEPIDIEVHGGDEDGDEAVRIVVRNSGPQIPPGLVTTLFEPFKRAARPAESGMGLGLGLYIVHAIVAAHGGTIAVRSLGRETTFTVELPRRAPAASLR